METANQPSTTNDDKNQPTVCVSTKALFSVDIPEIMGFLNDAEIDNTDLPYLEIAIQNASQAKKLMRERKYAEAAFYAEKGYKSIDELYQLRKELHPDYQILLAPFNYMIANILTTYMELNLDEFGNLVALETIEEDQSENAEESQDEEPNEEFKQENNNDDEPKIEEVQINTTTDPIENGQKKEEEEEKEDVAQMYFEDAQEQFSLSIQMIEDFINSERCFSGEKERRKKTCYDLLIDVYNRRAELLQFREIYQESIEDFDKVIELCKEQLLGNERILTSAYYLKGRSFTLLGDNPKSKDAYELSAKVLRQLLIEKYKKMQRCFEDNVSFEILTEPSALDTEEIIDLKENYKELYLCYIEADQCQADQKKIEQMKANEAQEVIVDETFGKAPVNANQFQDVSCKFKTGIKRTHEEAFPKQEQSTAQQNQEEPKRKKLDNDENSKLPDESNQSDKENNINI